MPFNIGPWEVVIILVVVLLVFGAKRLPDMGAAMGKGIREFKRNITEVKDSIQSGEDTNPKADREVLFDERRRDAARSGDEPKKLSE